MYKNGVSAMNKNIIAVLLMLILILITLIGLRQDIGPIAFGNLSTSSTWLFNLILITAFIVLSGYGVTGRWRGILIDNRNKLSLSRLQLLSWTGKA